MIYPLLERYWSLSHRKLEPTNKERYWSLQTNDNDTGAYKRTIMILESSTDIAGGAAKDNTEATGLTTMVANKSRRVKSTSTPEQLSVYQRYRRQNCPEEDSYVCRIASAADLYFSITESLPIPGSRTGPFEATKIRALFDDCASKDPLSDRKSSTKLWSLFNQHISILRCFLASINTSEVTIENSIQLEEFCASRRIKTREQLKEFSSSESWKSTGTSETKQKKKRESSSCKNTSGSSSKKRKTTATATASSISAPPPELSRKQKSKNKIKKKVSPINSCSLLPELVPKTNKAFRDNTLLTRNMDFAIVVQVPKGKNHAINLFLN